LQYRQPSGAENVDRQSNVTEPNNHGMPVMLVAQPISEDEINFFDVWQMLIKQKALIAITVAVTTSFGLLFAITATPVYQSETLTSPPSLTDINKLIIASRIASTAIETSGEKATINYFRVYTPEGIFENFKKHLASRVFRRDFFQKNGLVEVLAPQAKSEQSLRDAFLSFDKALTLKENSITLESTQRELSSEWLNSLVRQAALTTAIEIANNFNSSLQMEKNATQRLINSKINIKNQKQLDQIVILKESIAIAKQLGIKSYQVSGASLPIRDDFSSVSIATTVTPTYMRGTTSLEAELTSLQARKDSAAYTPELRELQEKLRQLNSLTIKPESFQVMHVDEAAITPEHHIKPQRKQIVIAALFIGLGLGIGIALIAGTIKKRETT